jgi:predicted nucleotidyltransferase
VLELRRYRDRDFLQTSEGYFFCTVGPAHPEDRVIAYLKYIPDPNGKWGRTNKRYRRVFRHYTMSDLLQTLSFVERFPEYMYYSSVWSVTMSAVPLSRVSAHFRPEEKMSQLVSMENRDILQQKAVDLACLISEESGVPVGNLGVTGSILLDIHQNFSDIDLTVYGMTNSRLVKKAVIQTYKEDRSPIRRFDARETEEWCIEKTKRFPLTYGEARAIYERKWGRGLFKGTLFSVHPVKLEEEISEGYGDRIFKPEGMVEIEGTVSDASEADFLPSIYEVTDVTIVKGNEVEDISEVASYEGLYGGIADEGQRILAYGKLEKVVDKRLKKEYHRVLVGSREAQGKDYIKPVCLS